MKKLIGREKIYEKEVNLNETLKIIEEYKDSAWACEAYSGSTYNSSFKLSFNDYNNVFNGRFSDELLLDVINDLKKHSYAMEKDNYLGKHIVYINLFGEENHEISMSSKEEKIIKKISGDRKIIRFFWPKLKIKFNI